MNRRILPYLVAMLAFGLLGAQGCNIVGPLGYIVGGPEKTDALYTLPDNRPAVVFVDDPDSRLPSRIVRQRMGKAAERELLDNKCVRDAEIVSSDAAVAASAIDRFGQRQTIAQIGQKVGAEVVVYVRPETFALSPDGAQFAPSGSARIKVVDASNGRRLWPAPDSADPAAQWHTVRYDLPTRQGSVPDSPAQIQAAEHQLAEELGRAVARVFFKHETKTRASRVGD
ncbi:MAG: hypothetical protein KF699_11985 [Phycisphaeraceae bacterium]|nr:hypothetical protein [Phycisphaeraceae bacterium]